MYNTENISYSCQTWDQSGKHRSGTSRLYPTTSQYLYEPWTLDVAAQYPTGEEYTSIDPGNNVAVQSYTTAIQLTKASYGLERLLQTNQLNLKLFTVKPRGIYL